MIKIIVLISLIVFSNTISAHSNLDCLASNIFYESRGENYKGKLAVANVTKNRVLSGKFPNTYCGVIFEKNQFSWTIRTKKIKYDTESYYIAKLSLRINIFDYTNGSLFYHVCGSKSKGSKWISRNKKPTVTIGSHCFYK